jgi:hypothetical protein
MDPGKVMSCNLNQDMWVNGMVDDVFPPCLFFSFSDREHGYLSLFSRIELMSISAQAFFPFYIFLDSHVLYGKRRYRYTYI